MPAAPKKIRKIFVLDTSVILYDHNAIMNFEEHDVAIPIPVLEELDEFKKGSDTKNFEAREFIRMLDKKAENKSLTVLTVTNLAGLKPTITTDKKANLRKTAYTGATLSLAPGIAAAISSILGLPENSLPDALAFGSTDVSLFTKAK